MATYYIWSGASGAGTGADWANAFTRLDTAFTGRAAGDKFFIAHDHAETSAANVSIVSPGTVNSYCQVICVDRTSGALATTAVCTITVNSNFTFSGCALYYGISFKSSGSINTTNSGPFSMRFESCQWRTNSGGTSIVFTIGGTTGSRDSLLEFVNTTVWFSNALQKIVIGGCVFIWRDTPNAILGTAPTAGLFRWAANYIELSADISGVDLSAITSPGYLVVNNSTARGLFRFRNCKLGSGATIGTAAPASQGGTIVEAVNCDSGATNYRNYRRAFQGEVMTDVTCYRVGGWTDGVTQASQKLVGSANCLFESPLDSFPIVIGKVASGSPVTVTIHAVTDGVTLTDQTAWIEVEYLGSSGSPLSSYASSRVGLIASPSNCQSSSATWSLTGISSPVYQKLTATFTPQMAGPVRISVKLAANATVWVCPKPELS